MSRGFGSTLGVGATDRIDLAYTDDPAVRSYHMRVLRNGDGASNFGRIFEKGTAGVALFNDTNVSAYDFRVPWSGAPNNIWAIPRGSAGAWQTIGIAYDGGATGNVPTAYVNGADQGALDNYNGPRSGTLNTNATAYAIGNRQDSARNWDGNIAEFAVWSELLTAAEFAALAKGASPLLIRRHALVEYASFVRDVKSHLLAAPSVTGTAVQPHPPIIMPAGQAAIANGAAPDAVGVDDATHAHTADAPVLSSALLAVIGDGAHAHSADNLTVLRDNDVVVSDGAHAHTAENLSLSSATGVVVADASHAHIAPFFWPDEVDENRITFVQATDAFIELSVSNPNFGVGPYTHQWHRSRVHDFTPGGSTLLAGETGTTLTDTTADPLHLYYYKVVSTDSLANEFVSLHRLASLWKKPVTLGFVGASTIATSWGTSAADCATYLSTVAGPRQASVGHNAGAGGTSSQDWVPASSLYQNALTAFQSAGVNVAIILMGVADIKSEFGYPTSVANFKTNIKSIAEDLADEGITAIVCTPLFVDLDVWSFDSRDIIHLGDYREAIIELIDELQIAGKNAHLGDLDGWNYFGANLNLYDDGIHLDAAGQTILGRMMGAQVARVVDGFTPAALAQLVWEYPNRGLTA